jgi:hypothetical protein
MRTFVAIVLLTTFGVSAIAQQVSRQTRVQEITLAFNKQKHVVKEKNGVRTEKYKDVRSESVTKPNIADYSGVYEMTDLGYVLNLQVESNGRVQGSGSDKGRTFRLENARIEGPLLTASKVYQDGATEKLEGVFLNRTTRNNPTDPGVTIFGLGIILNTPFEANGLTYEKLFYELRQ